MVGKGAVVAFLNQGHHVIVTTRDASKTAALKADLEKNGAKSTAKLDVVAAEFNTDAAAKAAFEAVSAKGPIKHVISVLGFVTPSPVPASQTTPDALNAVLDEGFWPSLRSINNFVPHLKDQEGASFTLLSGGLAHFVYEAAPPLWTGTLKNSFVNTLGMVLEAELRSAKLRFNVACLHYSVTWADAGQNQLGMPSAQNTNDFGVVFPAIASGNVRSQTLCFKEPADVAKFLADGSL